MVPVCHRNRPGIIREIETCDGRYIGELSIAEIEVATISFLAAP